MATTNMTTNAATARRIAADFDADTGYVQTHDVDAEEWANTVGDALLDALGRYADAHGAALLDVLDAMREQVSARLLADADDQLARYAR